MTFPFTLVSADSHIAEPPDLWTSRVDREFRDRAPHLIHNDNGDAYVIDGVADGVLIALMATKAKYADPGTRFGVEGRWADVPQGAYDPAARAAELASVEMADTVSSRRRGMSVLAAGQGS